MECKISSENTAAAAAAAAAKGGGGGIPAEVSFDSNSPVVDVNKNYDDKDSDRNKVLVPAATATTTATSSAKVEKGMYETHNLIECFLSICPIEQDTLDTKDPLHPDMIRCTRFRYRYRRRGMSESGRYRKGLIVMIFYNDRYVRSPISEFPVGIS